MKLLLFYSDATKSPKSPTTPVPVSVGGEMLARSPIGSVADLSSKLPIKIIFCYAFEDFTIDDIFILNIF